jgi:hypothetical protein
MRIKDLSAKMKLWSYETAVLKRDWMSKDQLLCLDRKIKYTAFFSNGVYEINLPGRLRQGSFFGPGHPFCWHN